MYNKHVLHSTLPGTMDTKYHLRPRPYNFKLTAMVEERKEGEGGRNCTYVARWDRRPCFSSRYISETA